LVRYLRTKQLYETFAKVYGRLEAWPEIERFPKRPEAILFFPSQIVLIPAGVAVVFWLTRRMTALEKRRRSKMKKRYVVIAGVLIIAGLAAYFIFTGLASSNATEYSFASVSRGNIETTISASGTLSPLTSVEVGTQTSGTVAEVYVDYNDQVTKGQLLAVLDTTVLKASVMDAEATVEKANAQLAQAQSDYDRNKTMFDSQLIAEATFLPFDIALRMQKASVKSAEVALLRAKRNLDYAVITSPINGIVISKEVEAGQTVAANFSTPTLFVIAQDLSHMEILAEVDESDIGEIRDGQDVRFEVTAYSNKKFTGVVRQIRLQPQTVSNVVTYTVVVEAPNEENLLLPGMTASLEFVIEHKEDVLMVSNKALKYAPDDATVQAFMEKRRQRMQDTGQARNTGKGDSARFSGSASVGMDSARGTGWKPSMVWYVDSTGSIAGAPLRTGSTDGTNTEIVSSPVLTENMQVITGNKSAASTKTTTTTTSSQRGGGFGPPPGGF
jgi:HlyD family secretion protein